MNRDSSHDFIWYESMKEDPYVFRPNNHPGMWLLLRLRSWTGKFGFPSGRRIIDFRNHQIRSGWWFWTLEFYDFPYIGNFIIPTDFHIFQRGRYTTNQRCICIYIYYNIFIGQQLVCMIFIVLNRYSHVSWARRSIQVADRSLTETQIFELLKDYVLHLEYWESQWGDDDVSEKNIRSGRIGFSVFHFKLWMELGFSSESNFVSSIFVVSTFKPSNLTYFVRAGLTPKLLMNFAELHWVEKFLPLRQLWGAILLHWQRK